MPILSGYDSIEVNKPIFKLPHGPHVGKIKSVKLDTVKRKDGSGSFKKLAVEVESGGGVVRVDTFVPANDAEWQSWSEGKKSMFKKALSALGLLPTDIDTDTGRGKAIGQMVEFKSKQHYKNAEWTDYEFTRLASNTTDSLPSVEDRLASQLGAEVTAPVTETADPFAAEPVV